MFVPCQHEIAGSWNSKHKTDADFGPAGLIKQAEFPVPPPYQTEGERMILWVSSCHVLLRKVDECLCLVLPAE